MLACKKDASHGSIRMSVSACMLLASCGCLNQIYIYLSCWMDNMQFNIVEVTLKGSFGFFVECRCENMRIKI